MNYKTIAASVLIGLMGSCNIYKPYERPKVEADGLYRDSLVNNEGHSMANLSWRELFTDPVLQKLIQEGLNNNLDLRTALLSIQQAEAQYAQGKAAFFPSLSLGGSYNRTIAKNGANTVFNGFVYPSWQIDLFGKLLNAKRAAKANLLSTKAVEQAIASSLVANIAINYYTLLMLDQQLHISESTLDKWKENVESMKVLKAASVVNEAAVAQSMANMYSVETTIPELRRQIHDTENRLALLLGTSGRTIERGQMEEQHFDQQLETGVSSLLLAKRPDVKHAEAQLMQAFANTNIARSQFYPSFTLNGNGGWSTSVLGKIYNTPQMIANLGASLAQPIFNGLQLKTQLKVAKLQQEQSLLNFQKVLYTAGIEVSDALFYYQQLEEKCKSRSLQLKALERSVESTQELLLLGSSTYIEVLTAQQSLLTAQISKANDQFSQIQAIIQLYLALGGGYE